MTAEQRLGPDDLVLSSGVLANPPIETLAEAAVAGGYRGVTLWPGAYHPKYRDGPSPAQMRARLSDAGLVVQDMDAAVIWVGPDDPGGPYFEEATLPEVIELAEELGAQAINVLLHTLHEVSLAQAVESFAGVCERAGQHGLGVHLEFSRGRVAPDIPRAAEIVRSAGHSNAGLMVDFWHVHYGPGSFGDLASLDGVPVTGVQVSDAPATPPEDFGWATRFERAFPGEGVIDARDALRRLADCGCSAPLSVEAFDDARVEREGAVPFARRLADAVRRLKASANPR